MIQELLAERRLAGAVLGAANLAEVVGKLVDVNLDAARFRGLLAAAGVNIEPFTGGETCEVRPRAVGLRPAPVTRHAAKLLNRCA